MRKENFDESVKHILEQSEFAYDPAAWEQAQVMLAQQRSHRLGGLWWTLLFLAVSGIVGAGISGIQEFEPKQAQSRLATATKTAATTAIITAPTSAASQPGRSQTLTPVTTGDSTNSQVKTPVRLLHPAPAAATAAFTDSTTTAAPEIEKMDKRSAEELNSPGYRLPFSNALRTVPKFDFSYEARPAAFQRQSGIAAFAWAGQQGRNVESNSLQQQYGFGLAWQLDLLPKLGLQLGTAIGYNNGFALASQKSDTSYGFGRTITTQTASATDYLQLQLPIGLTYRIAERHLLETGAAYHFYLGSSYRPQTDITYEDGNTSSSSAQLNGKITGIQIPKWSWYAGYRFSLNEAFDLGLRYQQQTTVGNGFPSEKSFRIVLHYHLYRFTL